jgi:uncharacterized membrane protein
MHPVFWRFVPAVYAEDETIYSVSILRDFFSCHLDSEPICSDYIHTMRTTRTVYMMFVMLTGMWCAGILAAPFFVHGNAADGSRELYAFYSRVCHQQDGRSFHLCGEKLGVCIRCTALYFSFFAGVLLYPVVRSLQRLLLPSYKLLIASATPMMIDVCLNAAGIMHSNTLSRVVSGMVFGFFASWFILPSLIEAVHQLLKKKNLKLGDMDYAG